MSLPPGSFSPTGVWIADDFRGNLIVDRDNAIFGFMRSDKRNKLRSENSEDVLTWNVFRSLHYINPVEWLPELASVAFGKSVPAPLPPATVSLWESKSPPPELLAKGPEGSSEIDVLLESTAWVWFIEAKFHSDIAPRTTYHLNRNQILRNLDVGTYYAGDRDFYFSLLVLDAENAPEGVRIINDYRDLTIPKQALAEHRPDGLKNLCAVSLLTWVELANVLQKVATTALSSEERGYATRAVEWMRERRIY